MQPERRASRGPALALALLAAAIPVFAPIGALAQTQGLPGGNSTVQQAVPGRLGPSTSNASPVQSIDQLLPDTSMLTRQGTATEAEGGPTVSGPLGEPMRMPGPSTTVFGANLFARGASVSTDTPNPNYVIAIGDRVSVRVWGAVESEAIGQVDADGNLFLPSIGPIRVAGTRAGDLQRVVESEVRRIYTQQVQVYAVLLNVNKVGVFVTGFVRSPGRHTGTGMDSVLDYLTRAGGVDPARGSYRDIQIQRNGRTVQAVDLYPFLLTGRLPRFLFQEGDTIVVAKQGALVSVDGAVRNNYLFEVPGRAMSGEELVQLAGPLPAATNVVVRGTRNGAPWSRYTTVTELRRLSLLDQDVASFITDAPPQTIRVTIEGSRIGPSVLIADRDIGLCQLLDHVAVDPVLADTRSVFLLRPSIAAQQRRTINETLDRLERQLFNASSVTTGVAEIRSSEAQLVSQYISRGRRVQPEGRLVVSDSSGRCTDTRLMDNDTIVIPERSEVVLVAGEVVTPQAIVWRPNLRVEDYVNQAGGFTQRGNLSNIMIRRPSGELILDPPEGPRPGDELIALPRLDPKLFQIGRDILQLIYQSALSARVFQ
ncbi:protein involved in polysaccharide export, contains SLBB domain of the beta-grasp fold [Roseomonas rosea]|uniref:Protein involved in polysaccharide export, contains SLBB domain of the beta-grasp fold n=1 Tax=Muricoccus roseus TaxID=198092 RepID=A0A1M6G643_9PROT|nr:polysaccharide biosynthesis/export family protein [Roseomonas rosea]SHJ05422.1 protein involved in polysaccharide export, contains SLBB domain of the beta-grasp fold [Roseomonas rosea]